MSASKSFKAVPLLPTLGFCFSLLNTCFSTSTPASQLQHLLLNFLQHHIRKMLKLVVNVTCDHDKDQKAVQKINRFLYYSIKGV